MREWWENDVGDNLLGGTPGDPDNPPKLKDDFILDFLTKIPAARTSYLRLVPKLLPEEQSRLQMLYQIALSSSQVTDEKALEDRIQSKWNKTGIQTAGVSGGTRRGGNR